MRDPRPRWLLAAHPGRGRAVPRRQGPEVLSGAGSASGGPSGAGTAPEWAPDSDSGSLGKASLAADLSLLVRLHLPPGLVGLLVTFGYGREAREVPERPPGLGFDAKEGHAGDFVDTAGDRVDIHRRDGRAGWAACAGQSGAVVSCRVFPS